MLQSSLVDRFAFDPFSFEQDGLPASEVDVGGREVVQAFVISVVIVVRNERVDLRFEVARVCPAEGGAVTAWADGSGFSALWGPGDARPVPGGGPP